MEKESFFLSVLTNRRTKFNYVDNETGKEVRVHNPEILNVVKKLNANDINRDIEEYTRIAVDYDVPVGSLIQVILILVRYEDNGVIATRTPKPVAIAQTNDEAKLLTDEIKNGGYRRYLDKGESFEEVYNIPFIVTNTLNDRL